MFLIRSNIKVLREQVEEEHDGKIAFLKSNTRSLVSDPFTTL